MGVFDRLQSFSAVIPPQSGDRFIVNNLSPKPVQSRERFVKRRVPAGARLKKSSKTCEGLTEALVEWDSSRFILPFRSFLMPLDTAIVFRAV